jgi:hypothetical protein
MSNVAGNGWDISGPGEGSAGDPNRFTNSRHVDHTVIFIGFVGEERTGRPRDGKTEQYQVAATSYVVCLTDKRCWADVDVSGKALVPRLLSATGSIVVGVLIEGEKGGYDNAPILLADPTPAELAEAEAVLDTYGHRMPSGRILFDDVAYNKVASPDHESF